MKKRIFLQPFFTGFLLVSLLSYSIQAQEFPEKPVPQRLVNDFARLLTSQEADALEQKLVAYNDSSSTQISIVTIADLQGYDKSDYAQRLAEKWGIGQKGLNNGILILIKPKTSESSRGEVFIAPGYGLEGVVPDIVCAQIVDNEILPAFRAGAYYQGLDRATTTLMSLASGEFPPDQYGKKDKGEGLTPIIIFIIFLIIIMFFRSNGGSNQKHISRKGLPLWLLLSMMNSNSNSHNGSWGGFSGGGGFGGGGSGGGFGGFGGGSFGGGGAGGSW
jgi:uncharacterized protein